MRSPAALLRTLLLPPLQRLALLVAFATGGVPSQRPLRALARRSAGRAADGTLRRAA